MFCRGRGQAAVESLASDGLKALFHQLDIDDLNSITSAAAFFKEKYGGVDVLVNNAGIAFKGMALKPCSVMENIFYRTYLPILSCSVTDECGSTRLSSSQV